MGVSLKQYTNKDPLSSRQRREEPPSKYVMTRSIRGGSAIAIDQEEEGPLKGVVYASE